MKNLLIFLFYGIIDLLMKHLFTAAIYDWTSWGNVFQSIIEFKPLIQHIFNEHALQFSNIENCTPCTNKI